LLSVPELAEYLGVPVSTLYLWRTQGVGATGFRVGKQLRYRVDDVVAWLKRQANQTP
jgi:excisionase family DNA binding protein